MSPTEYGPGKGCPTTVDPIKWLTSLAGSSTTAEVRDTMDTIKSNLEKQVIMLEKMKETTRVLGLSKRSKPEHVKVSMI